VIEPVAASMQPGSQAARAGIGSPDHKLGRDITVRRREFIAGLSSAATWPVMARAQAYPSRSVRIIVAASAGGGTDIAARLIGQWLSEQLGRFFLIENRPGANNTIGTGAVVRAPADGYTLLMASSIDTINPSLYQRLNYDFIRDIVPIARIALTPLVLVVNAGSSIRSVPEFIAYAKANPGKLNMGAGGLGTPVNVASELFKMKTGIVVGQVQYRGEGPMVIDLIVGQLQIAFASMPAVIEFIRDGRLRALAVTSTARSDILRDIPTMTDYVPGIEASFWVGIGAPKNTPVEVIDKLNTEINAGLADPTMKARFSDLGATVFPGSPSDFGEFIAEETEKWSKAVKFAGVRADEQAEPVRRIGVLVLAAENDFMQRDATLAFREELRKLGWIEGGNLQIDLRFGAGDSSRTRTYAEELVSLGPDVIVTSFQLATRAAQQQTEAIPIIFAGAGDPSADGTVRNIARPEGNTTGFTDLNASFGGKWIQLLKEVAPGVARVGLIRDAGALSSAYIPHIDAVAQSLGVNTIPLPIRNAAEIELALRAFALEPNGALIVLPDASSIAVRELIRLAAAYRLPAIYADRRIVVEGGMMSYGTDIIQVWRQTTSYVDRILRGAKPGDLPVQFPTKFELVVNVKTAKALGLTIPESFLIRADEVIE
jgi:tripartite-type tricarboxylate transporter receptor subunit TctC/ABC-type uncharacterized transport system substrate-binding protein